MTSRYGFERLDPRREEAAACAAAEAVRRERGAAQEKCRRLLSRVHWLVVDILTDYKQALTLPGELRHLTDMGASAPMQSLTGAWGFRQAPTWEIRQAEWSSYIDHEQQARLRLMREEVHVRVVLNLADIDAPSFTVHVRAAGRSRATDDRNHRRLLDILTQKTGIRAVPASESERATGGAPSGHRGRQ